MNLKQLFGIVLFFMLLISIQSCTKDFSVSEKDETLKAADAGSPTVKTKYCKYNVDSTTVDGISPGDIVCFACDPPCTNIVNQDFKKNVPDSQGNDSTIVAGVVSGTRASSSCVRCSASYAHISE